MKARPFIGMHCVDCTVGTFSLNEFYSVRNDVWEQAWAGRRKPWHAIRDNHSYSQEILCIGCLERRLGRTLSRHDFTDAPINELGGGFEHSDRLRDRLTADGPPRKITP